MKIYLAIFLCLYSSAYSFSQDSFCSKIEKLIKVAQEHHFKPIEVDQEFQTLVEDYFFENLDPYQLVFTKQDLEDLKSSHSLQQMDCEWISKIHTKLKINLPLIDEVLSNLKSQELDFEKDEKFIIAESSLAKDKQDLKNQWRKYLKFRMLNELEANESKTPDVNLYKDQILDNLNCRIKKLKVEESELEHLYLQCISVAFDPHSFYFPAIQADLFLQELKGNSKSYGLVLSSKNDDIIIEKVIPGSSAWNSNAINEGDVILELENSEGTRIKFNCLSHSECQEILLQQNGKITLEIRKANRHLKKVSITKEVLSETEDRIQSYVLEKENKVAYIYLPSFYSGEEFNAYQSTGCAKDLTTELIKLKREKVEALILDLRNNGGGSMFEALHMVGLFIDYGSLIILEERNDVPEVIKDMNRGVIFDKPLIVLINNLSASASEMVAGVLQDYNRALIVGSRSFGKSSSQVFYDLEGNLFDGEYDSKKDLIKLTTGLFYRVNSNSHQKIGIVPDIVLPEPFEHANPQESDYPNALENNVSEKKTTFKALVDSGFEDFENKWNQNMLNNEYFNKIKTISTTVKADELEKGVSLNINNYLDNIANKQKLVEEIEKGIPNYFDRVSFPDFKQSIVSQSDFNTIMNEEKLKNIGKDPYIIYSFEIIQDMINHKN